VGGFVMTQLFTLQENGNFTYNCAVSLLVQFLYQRCVSVERVTRDRLHTANRQ